MTGGHQSRYAGLGLASMFLPTIAALTVGAMTNEKVTIDWRRFPVSYAPIALLLMPVALHAIMLLRMTAAGPLPWQDWLTPQPDGLYHSPASRGWGVLTAGGLVA